MRAALKLCELHNMYKTWLFSSMIFRFIGVCSKVHLTICINEYTSNNFILFSHLDSAESYNIKISLLKKKYFFWHFKIFSLLPHFKKRIPLYMYMEMSLVILAGCYFYIFTILITFLPSLFYLKWLCCLQCGINKSTYYVSR